MPLKLTVLLVMLPNGEAPGENIPAIPMIPLPARVILVFVFVTVKLL